MHLPRRLWPPSWGPGDIIGDSRLSPLNPHTATDGDGKERRNPNASVGSSAMQGCYQTIWSNLLKL